MNEIQNFIENCKQHKEIFDLLNEITQLNNFYNSYNFSAMDSLIEDIMKKYAIEAKIWNTLYSYKTESNSEKYVYAVNFLKAKCFSLVLANLTQN